MKKIIVATPSLTGRVEAHYTISLANSIKLCLSAGIELCPVFLAYESMLPDARNELLNAAFKGEYDQLVFIDSDQSWDAHALLTLVKSSLDVLGLPVVNKGERPQFNVFGPKSAPDELGFVEVNRVGTGFLKLSKQAVSDLWSSSSSYEFRGRTLREICEYWTVDGSRVGEDIVLCEKLKELGYKIWVYTLHTVSHVGYKVYRGDYAKTLK